MAIGRLERFVADWEMTQGAAPLPEMPKKTGKKVAVVGKTRTIDQLMKEDGFDAVYVGVGEAPLSGV